MEVRTVILQTFPLYIAPLQNSPKEQNPYFYTCLMHTLRQNQSNREANLFHLNHDIPVKSNILLTKKTTNKQKQQKKLHFCIFGKLPKEGFLFKL